MMSGCLKIPADDMALLGKDQELSWMSPLNAATLQAPRQEEVPRANTQREYLYLPPIG